MAENHVTDQEAMVISGLQQQQRRIQSLLTQVVEPEAWAYLNEGALCFAVGAYDAAVAMGWCAVISFYRLVARQHYQLFSYCYQVVHKKPIGDPSKIGDWELIQACDQMGMVQKARGKLDDFQAKRNRSAHPGRISVNPIEPIEIGLSIWPSEVVSLFEQAVNLFLCNRAEAERLTGTEGAILLLDFLKNQSDNRNTVLDQQTITQLLNMLDPEQYRFLAHRLRLTLQSEKYHQPASQILLCAWELLLQRLDQQGRHEQLKGLRDKIQEFYDPDLKMWDAQAVIWLSELMISLYPDSEDEVWGQLCKILIESLEQVAGTDENVNIPRPILRMLRAYSPSEIKERVEAVTQKLFYIEGGNS